MNPGKQPSTATQAARLLLAVRRGAPRLAALPAALAPQTLADAYAIQHALLAEPPGFSQRALDEASLESLHLLGKLAHHHLNNDHGVIHQQAERDDQRAGGNAMQVNLEYLHRQKRRQ